MNFTLNPPSGHADSYMDIQFSVEFESETSVKLEFFNETSKLPISIIGVNSGYVEGHNVAVFKNAKVCSGFIDLFPEDKMNLGLQGKDYVIIRCNAVVNAEGKEQQYSSTAIFYNESQSLDAGVVPFDLVIENKRINVTNHDSLRIKIVSPEEKTFELCIKSSDKESWCCFLVAAKKGITPISIPAAVLYSDLNLKKNSNLSFKMYYVKQEGMTYSRFMNRKFIPIMNTELLFLADNFSPQATTNNGPLGPLSSDFILSDRYFVHTLRDFSSFKTKDEYPYHKLFHITAFFYESQDMDSIKNAIAQFSASDQVASTVTQSQKILRSESVPYYVEYQYPTEKAKLLGVFSKKYIKQEPKDDEQSNNGTILMNKKKKPCGSCGRNKHV